MAAMSRSPPSTGTDLCARTLLGLTKHGGLPVAGARAKRCAGMREARSEKGTGTSDPSGRWKQTTTTQEKETSQIEATPRLQVFLSWLVFVECILMIFFHQWGLVRNGHPSDSQNLRSAGGDGEAIPLGGAGAKPRADPPRMNHAFAGTDGRR